MTHVITGLNDGGAEAALYRLCQAVATSRPDIRQRVVSLDTFGKYGAAIEAVGIEVFAVDLRHHPLSGLRDLLRVVGDPPGVMQTWMYHANLFGGVAARLRGSGPVVWGLHHTKLDPRTSSRATVVVDWLSARLSRGIPDAIVSCSRRGAADHVEIGYFSPNFSVISNGYDSEKFAPDPAARERVRAELGVAPGTFLIGAVGRFVPEKDHANLLAALGEMAAEFPGDWRLLLVGTGMDTKNTRLGGLIDGAGLSGRVQLAGRRDDIPAIMNALDLHVLSSSSEAFPNVVGEAMACGTPAIVTDVGDAAEIVGGVGWVVPPRSPQALAQAIGHARIAQRNTDIWRTIQRGARQRIVENYSIEHMRDAYLDLWERIARRKA